MDLRWTLPTLTGHNLSATVKTPKTGGIIQLSVTAVESRAITSGRYLYTMEVFTPSDVDVIRVSEGTILISPTTYRAPVA
jgi:hypothetical protein